MIFHPQLAAGRWREFSLMEQLANVGSEVGRAINWRRKKDAKSSYLAFWRALELIDLTIADPKNHTHARLKELTRARECLVDFFAGDNIYSQTADSWERYFLAFNYAARAGR